MIRTRTVVGIQVAVVRLLRTVSIAARIAKQSKRAAKSHASVGIPIVREKSIDPDELSRLSKTRREKIATSRPLSILDAAQISVGGTMNKDEVKGKAKDIAGRVQRQAGEWTGNDRTQAKGAAKQVEGKVQNAWGKVKDAAKSDEDDTK